MTYTTVDEEFNTQYDEAGLQPSVGERPRMNLAQAKQLGNNVTRVTGVSMRQGGKKMQRTGKGMMRVGKTISKSGLGALVGVPMMAAGAAMSASGAANKQVGGKFSRQAQDSKKLLGTKNFSNLGKGIKKRASVTRINITVLSTVTPIWFTLQLPLALTAIFSLGFAGIGDAAAQEIMNSTAINFLYGGYDSITNAVQDISGINLNIIENWVDFGGVLFAALTMLVFLMGMFILFLMAILYTVSGVRCFTGQHTTFKMATFIFAMLGYLLPVLNILPWFMLWGIIVWRYPK